MILVIGIVIGALYVIVTGYLTASFATVHHGQWYVVILAAVFGWLVLPAYGVGCLFSGSKR